MEKPDMIAIIVTWATADLLITKYSVPGYESFFKNRLNKRGGGVICFIKNTLPVMKIENKTDKYTLSILNLKPANTVS